MDRKTAEQIVALANSCVDQLLTSLGPVENAVSPEDFAAYKRGVAKVINALDVEIIDRVARDFPDLKPADDDSGPANDPGPPKASHN